MHKKDTIIGFRAEPPLREALNAGAAKMQISRSDFVRHVLRDALGLFDHAANSDRHTPTAPRASYTEEAS